jgi:hypothetical protein
VAIGQALLAEHFEQKWPVLSRSAEKFGYRI